MKFKKELKIGIYFSVMLIAFVWGVNFLKGRDIFGKVNTFYAIYDNVEGLQNSSQVLIKGMKVGTVSSIKLDQETDKFIIALQIKSTYVIPEDSEAVLFSSDIMGNKAIRIVHGASQNELKDKKEIKSRIEANMISAFTDDLPTIKDSLKKTIATVNATLNNVNKLLNEQTLNNVSKSVGHLANTLENFEDISTTLNQNSYKITGTLTNLNDFTTSLKNNGPKIDKAINNFADLSDTLKALPLGQTVNEINTILADIKSGEGTAGKLIYNDSVYVNLSKSLENLDLLLLDIKANPKRYINLSVFGGKSK